jgi:drug/metabolite transporter (DMT)-like permease
VTDQTHQASVGLYVKLVLVAACWGGQFIAGRVLAPMLPHFTSGALRFAVALAVLIPLVYRLEGGLPRLDGRQTLWMLALGATGVFGLNAFFFAALETVPAGRGALIMALIPIGTAIGAALVFHDRLTWMRWLGIALALCGAWIVITHGHPQRIFDGAIGVGELLLFGCVLSWVIYTLLGRIVLRQVSPLATTTWAAIYGTAMLAAVAVFERPWDAIAALSPTGWIAVVYLGVFGTVVAFLWYYEGVRAIGAPRAGVFINLVPVFAVAFAALLLGERVLASMVSGGLMVIAGVAWTNQTPGMPSAR